MKSLTVKGLKTIINDAPDDAYVLISKGSDHDYREASVFVTTAMRLSYYEYTEDHGETYTPEGDEYGIRVPAVIIE